ncbi:MAG: S8 family serine peptidase [Gemmatimonadota bacterium]
MRRSALLLGATLLVLGCEEGSPPVAPDATGELALIGPAGTSDVIVLLDPTFAPGGHGANKARAAEVARQFGVTPRHAYGTAVFGFAGSVPEGRLNALRRDPRVLLVERDGIASIPIPRRAAPPWCPDNPDHPGCSHDDNGGSVGQVTPWGITRVGGPWDGTGKTAWIIDTGIDLDHPDLSVDRSRSANFVTRGKDSPDDGNGHGTHVAGTIGAIDNAIDVVGAAAGATVVAVRVLDNSGSGSVSGVVAGVDYVAANGSAGDVANMSLGASGHFESLHQAVENAAAKGIRFSIAAGNAGDDAGGYEPAHVEHPNVYTTSAIGKDDCLASWSNWGNPPVDYAAPGVGVLSTKRGGGTTTMSGTSMAAPHMGGVLLASIATDGAACNDPDGSPDLIVHF